MGTATMQPTSVFLATGPLYAMRRTGQDIETRPAWYASLFDRNPGLEQAVADFSHAWRARSRCVAMAALLARRPSPPRLDPVTFLRLVGRDVREHPDNWAHDIEASPDLGRDLARLSRALSQSVAALAREGGRAT
jgi:hypothetical protein